MKIIFSESNPDYGSYTFPYVVWALAEDDIDAEELYNRGFLPADWPRFYLTRSTRIVLSRFKAQKSLRMILNRNQDITYEVLEAQSLELSDEELQKFHECAERRFGNGVVDEERLNKILKVKNCSHLLRFIQNGKTIGVVTLYVLGKSAHYNFCFYDLSLLERSIGNHMMLTAAQHFKSTGFEYLYLGTCYAEHFKYKARFAGFEFFNGIHWSSNVKELEYLLKNNRQTTHLLEDENYTMQYAPLDRVWLHTKRMIRN